MAMPDLPIYNRTGDKVGDFAIEATDLAPSINRQLLHDAVVMYQANTRLGTASSKTRAQVAGSTKKMYRQKGTGNARAGSRRSGIRRGGGHIFAKKPRSFYYRLPRKALKLATRMAIASRVKDDEVVIVDELNFDAPKTKDMATILKSLKIDAGTTLVAVESYSRDLYLSTRNIEGVDVMPVSDINALVVLKPHRVLFTQAALQALKDGSVAGNNASPEKDQAAATE